MKMLLALLTLGALAVGCDRREANPPYGRPTDTDGKPVSVAQVKDPVCGMEISSDKAKDHSYQGVKYYFCSQKCHDDFEEFPQAYVEKAVNEAK
jgi:YHS domain-containing protein